MDELPSIIQALTLNKPLPQYYQIVNQESSSLLDY